MERRRADPERYREQHRATYWRNVEANRARVRAYAKTQRGLAVNRSAVERYRERNPRKVAAHQAVYLATRNGTLVRPEACSKCGIVAGTAHGHHEDYSRPLDVTWLCRTCHDRRHWPGPDLASIDG